MNDNHEKYSLSGKSAEMKANESKGDEMKKISLSEEAIGRAVHKALDWCIEATAASAQFMNGPEISGSAIVYQLWCERHQVSEEVQAAYHEVFRRCCSSLMESFCEPHFQEALFLDWFLYHDFQRVPPFACEKLSEMMHKWSRVYSRYTRGF